LNLKIASLQDEKKKLEENHNNLMKDLENSLEKYMKNLPESPLLLSVKTKILIERKNITIDHISFSPTDTTDKLYEIVKNYFINLGDEINFDESVSNFFIIRKEIKLDINSEINQNETEIPIKKGIKFLSTGLIHGDIIYLKQSFSLKSEAPKSCLTYQFEDKNMNSIVNYFSCESCKLNCKYMVNFFIKLFIF
jgi:hypothetical protein